MNEFELQHLPEAYRPLSPWSYFGLGILYALPLLGWIFLIVHAIGSANINRRNYGDHSGRPADDHRRTVRPDPIPERYVRISLSIKKRGCLNDVSII